MVNTIESTTEIDGSGGNDMPHVNAARDPFDCVDQCVRRVQQMTFRALQQIL